MLVLALDTATAATTVAVVDLADAARDGGGPALRVLAEGSEEAANRHGEVLAPLVAGCLADAGVTRTDLGMVAVGTGPGPFTGLRVGLVTARALGDALGVPVHGISTLDVIAADHRHAGDLAVLTDARRREVYWARYDAGGERVAGPAVDRPVALAERWRADGFAGTVAGAGAVLYRDLLADWHVDGAAAFPRAATLARLAAPGSPYVTGPEPLYLRRPDARPYTARKPVAR